MSPQKKKLQFKKNFDNTQFYYYSYDFAERY